MFWSPGVFCLTVIPCFAAYTLQGYSSWNWWFISPSKESPINLCRNLSSKNHLIRKLLLFHISYERIILKTWKFIMLGQKRFTGHSPCVQALTCHIPLNTKKTKLIQCILLSALTKSDQILVHGRLKAIGLLRLFEAITISWMCLNFTCDQNDCSKFDETKMQQND